MWRRGLVVLALVLTTAATAAIHDELDSYGYPVVVSKRAALVLDRILIALRDALREDQKLLEVPVPSPEDSSAVAGGVVGPAALRVRSASAQDDYVANAIPEDRMDLQRRGHSSSSGRGRVLRCYFNAVTCFRRK